jgi:hypothetical protein
LVRAAIGAGLTLAGLEPGQWRDITAAEQLELQRLLVGSGANPSAPQFNRRSTRPTSYPSGPRRHP